MVQMAIMANIIAFSTENRNSGYIDICEKNCLNVLFQPAKIFLIKIKIGVDDAASSEL